MARRFIAVNERSGDQQKALAEEVPRPGDLKAEEPDERRGDVSQEQVFLRGAEAFEVGLGEIDTVLAEVHGDVLPEVGQLERGADAVRQPSQAGIAQAEQVKDDPAHRVRRVTAVMEQVVKGGVAAGRDIHPEGGQEVPQELHGEVEAPDGVAEGDERGVRGRVLQTGVEQALPLAQAFEALPLVGGFVREVVGGAGEGVDGADVRTEGLRQEPGGHREVLVVVPRDPLAVGVGLREGWANRSGRLAPRAGVGVGLGHSGS